jgi:hypothetical protein
MSAMSFKTDGLSRRQFTSLVAASLPLLGTRAAAQAEAPR